MLIERSELILQRVYSLIRSSAYDAERLARQAEHRARQQAGPARQDAEAQAATDRRARQQAQAARRHLEERLAVLQEIVRAQHRDPDGL